MAEQNLHVLLGEIKGKLDMVIASQSTQESKLDNIGLRMNKVEHKSTINGFLSGSIAAVGISIIRQKLGV